MTCRKDFYNLLSDEKFQNGIFNFDSFDSNGKKAFIRQYSINREEFVKARAILRGLDFKEVSFSEEELDYLWERLDIGSSTGAELTTGKTMTIISQFYRAAAVLLIPLLIASAWLFYQNTKLKSFNKENISRLAGVYNTVSAPVGGRAKAVLPDGSEVWLNSGSSVQYPLLANPDYREVKLTGEAFFKVVKNPRQPMFVYAPGVQVKVYGTTFNMNAYQENADIETILVEGEISLVKLDEEGNAEKREYKIKPGEVGRLNRKQNTISIDRAANPEVFTGWVNGKYVFRNQSFRSILERLEKIHNVAFVLEDKSLGEYSFDATFEDQNIDRIMEIFAVSLPIKWRSVQAEQKDDNTFSVKQIIISKDTTWKIK
jgi:ferric-dicitrate binding protein FerR (iron transport regulator)